MPHILEQYRIPDPIKASIRPEELLINPKCTPDIRAVVDDCVFLGLNTHCYMHLEDGTAVECIEESKLGQGYEKGTELSLTVNMTKANLFAADGSANILEGVRNDCDAR